MQDRHITPSQLALFSRSPVIGAWWEEVHATDPDRAPRPAAKALDQLLYDAGLEHEKVLVARLRAEGKAVAKLDGKQRDSDYEATEAAMRSGVDYIWQASLRNGEMRGSADLLERIEQPSNLGAWSYIPIECKLSSHPKPIYLVQACAYCELLTPILGSRPEQFKLYLGKSQFQTYRSAEFWSWYEQLRQRYRVFRASFNANQEPEHAPGDHGLWEPFIQEELEKRRDLILVAGMRQSQRSKLRAAGINTAEQLAAWPAEQAVMADRAIQARLQEQARIQIAPLQPDGRPAVAIRPPAQQARGLALLPTADAGDIWFDMEGYPNPITGHKLEYLFGACYRDEQGERRFIAWWAHDEPEERIAFDGFMQWVMARRITYPNLHVYHYASYEKTALGNLASRHQLHQPLWDQWLREELFVDLYPIVRHGLLLGAPSYSIKKVEGLYLTEARQQEVTNAADSVVQYAQWIKSNESRSPGRGAGESLRLQELQDYNEKDCESTEELHRYLLGLPIWADSELKHRPNRWDAAELNSDSEATKATERELEILARTLREEVPTKMCDPHAIGSRGMSWGQQKLLAQLIDFQEREGKVEWWEFFNRINGMSAEERDDDTEVIAAAAQEGSAQQLTSQSRGYRYRFSAQQPLKLAAKPGQQLRFAMAPLLEQANGTLIAQEVIKRSDGRAFEVDGVFDADDPCVVTLKLSGRKLSELKGLGHHELPRRVDLIPLPKQIYKRMLGDLLRQAQAWVLERQPLTPAMQHLLERRPIPVLKPLNADVRREPNSTARRMADFLADADGLTLSLQGPPGTGKTTVTGELIARLVQQGKRVAVSSQGHEAINNLLKRTQGQLDDRGHQGLVVKLASSTSEASDQTSLKGTAVQALRESAINRAPDVLGATVFALVREGYADAPFDLLVIDEAGQVSLSNLLYMSQCARNILLVGDQQQLSQPNRAKHPDGSGLSCLDYVMDGRPVVPDDRGVFLATSWRMPPPLTAIVSELFYEGKLRGNNDNAANRVLWKGCQQGLVYQPVEHQGNGSGSDEEVDAISALVDQLLDQPYERLQLRDGVLQVERQTLRPKDILITAPYNLQVNRLQRRLEGRARVGTVDRFQGQEAPVAIHSLTASDGDSAPRGLAFVLDPNRLNVAISRAQCLSIVVGSPQLATGISSSVDGVRQLNRLCRLMAADCQAQPMEASA